MVSEKEFSNYRSGSAPPTVEGSLNAVGGLFVTEEELRADPAYVNYYYTNVNLNPRLPPPLLSKEDWLFTRRLESSGGGGVVGGIWDRRKVVGSSGNGEGGNMETSLFSVQPGFRGKEENGAAATAEWNGDGLIGLPGLGGGIRQKSIAEIIQDGKSHASSRPASRNAIDDRVETSKGQYSRLHRQGMSLVQNIGGSATHSYAAALGASLSRSTTPDPQVVARAPSPRIPSAGGVRASSVDQKSVNGQYSFGCSDLVTSLSGLDLSNGMLDEDKHDKFVNSQSDQLHSASQMVKGSYPNIGNPNPSTPNYGFGGYAIPGVQLGLTGMDARAFGGTLGSNLMGAASELQSLNVGSYSTGNALQVPLVDPMYLQYPSSNWYAPTMDRELMANSYTDLLGMQKPYFGTFLSPQKSQYGVPYLGKSGSFNHGYYGNPAFGLGVSYPGSPLAGSLIPNSPFVTCRHSEQFGLSLLDECKSNKTISFELSEIAGHVVEFSADQYGSRFIQQKLETASKDEKDMVFNEIMPQALSLMTDVFGNYVIQKFFEHGTESQIRVLADQLTSNVLTLSLQMYGCRVIQKAIEVVNLDQQSRMVAELDGHIMRCVRDQNGNHVIQKCIECIPQDAIQFIFSTFYDQVVTLSTHPYGCRVIQRVLEHCHDPKTQRVIMDAVFQSVLMLAQDQYGNYVVQHLLEHGKPDERSTIIKKLTGQIVVMSQQKFASNVIEKCLTFGTPTERQILVNEMIGANDNDPLQVMMKDQYANYVVQKVLETCDDRQLELILNRIKVHLTALKKYTYGKHIVARVEKLVAAGEKRISIQTNSATMT